jgi:polysaccharide biosynthesis protein PslH
MRILFVTQIVPYPPHGGVLQRGFNLVRELGRHHEVHLLAFHHLDELPMGEPYEASRRELGKFCASVEYFPLWVKRSKFHKVLGLLGAGLYPKPYSVLAHKSPALTRRVRELCLSSKRPDIVHLDTIGLAPLATECGDVPVVLAHHNVESQLMARRGEVQPGGLAKAYIRMQAERLVRYEREQCERFALNIMVSRLDAEVLSRACPGIRTVVIPNGVDTDYFAPRPGSETPAVIYTGGMQMFANRDAVDWFLEAIWPKLKAAVPGIKFLAVGQRPSAKVLAASALDPDIEAPGFVPDVRTWVARAAVYVVPLRVGGGTRLKMVDAMAQGKAIVATTVGAEGIEGDNGRHFLLEDSPDAFAAATIRLLNDATARNQLGQAARARAEEVYAWPLLGAQLAGYYEQVIAEARR